MYHAIVRRQVRKIFAGLSRGDWESALAGMADRFEHIFPGDHALGGTRHSKAGLRAWFQRLFAVHPVLKFEIKHIASSGTPWDTTAVIEWRDRAVMADGDTSYVNDGVHIIRLRWGKIVSLHPYLDTAKYAAALKRLADTGFAPAAAPPIED
ncbi:MULTISPECIES: nuclear transport factor 2 family protein [Sphingopyxis]|uniref:nuclear transport factor 2 family protein n=1 Tax=Sphingopyxis TaxID=165697 RepID=UPI0015CD5860|nr:MULTISPECIES: nuclear transport factor 2 family protein [Sphingopyxis]NYF33593.1 ketosteroid isomerase-like protein [Sphingopyxis sp. JAI108]